VHVAIGVLFDDGASHLPHIVALIRVLGKRHRQPVQLEVSQPGGQRQDVHLPARIVHVVFALDEESRGIQQVGQARAERGAAAVADVQWAGRVGRDELDLNPLATPIGNASIGVRVGENVADDALLGGGREEQVD
jgi:hypothetical protein